MAKALFSADWLVPITGPPVREGAVCFDDEGSLVSVGEADALARAHPEARQTHVPGTLLPALVNAHTHLELSALHERVPGGDGLVSWVGRLLRAQAEVSPSARLAAAEAAVEALWETGTAGLGNVGNELWAAPTLRQRPLQGIYFHERLGSAHALTGDALAQGRAAFERLRGLRTWPPRFVYRQAPHAPYSADPDLLARLFGEGHGPTTIHVAEDRDELALLLRGEGRWPEVLLRLGADPARRTPRSGPLSYLQSLGAFASPPPPLLVHMCHASAEDIALAAAHAAPVVLCPRSNLHISNELPPVRALHEAGVPLALGTDSLASADSLSLWDEMATLAENFSDVPARVWLHAATAGGARALRLERLGALAVGKKPGLIALDVNEADPEAALVHARPRTVNWIVQP